MRSRTILSAVFSIVLAANAVPAQTIFVEDFETPITTNYATFNAGQVMITAGHSWAVTLNSIDLYNGPARPEAGVFDGTQAVDMTGSPGEGSMETTFTTVPGTTYDLVFHYARNAYIDPGIAEMKVEIIGTTTVLEDSVTHALSQYPFSAYQAYQGSFTADTTETMIRFTGRNPGIAGITLDGISIAVADATGAGNPALAARDAITGAYPNPFNPAVSIDYTITEAGAVEVSVYDARGALVRALVRETQPAGAYAARWNGTDAEGRSVSSGVYFAVLTTPRGVSTRKLVLIK